MLALLIEDTKGFMVKLLKEGVFDEFLLKSAVIDSFARFEVYAPQTEGGVCWSGVRDHVYHIVKGAAAPRGLKIVFCADMEKFNIINAGGLFINIHFEAGKIMVTTGLSVKSFSLDKSSEEEWDAAVLGFLEDAGIGCVNQI